jgi:hypothetical protein
MIPRPILLVIWIAGVFMALPGTPGTSREVASGAAKQISRAAPLSRPASAAISTTPVGGAARAAAYRERAEQRRDRVERLATAATRRGRFAERRLNQAPGPSPRCGRGHANSGQRGLSDAGACRASGVPELDVDRPMDVPWSAGTTAEPSRMVATRTKMPLLSSFMTGAAAGDRLFPWPLSRRGLACWRWRWR